MADKKTQASVETETDDPKLGWNDYAEKLNGRFAMIGLTLLLLLEFFTRQDFFTWLGLK
ncbi:high light inducible protein [filamentous cyanobacterium LEGE 11480]|uniref:High light inducible protein n=1 Tax=Romeriopsis navalis LEGE 11480 TaxID=2777977 RepID=A0A928VRQ3_9CYAN|nr:high light inducible protein [Romeriopsis navalis]MBE9030944.1 high light inducible protein [Romeriopsis navalis LEGE 11480]